MCTNQSFPGCCCCGDKILIMYLSSCKINTNSGSTALLCIWLHRHLNKQTQWNLEATKGHVLNFTGSGFAFLFWKSSVHSANWNRAVVFSCLVLAPSSQESESKTDFTFGGEGKHGSVESFQGSSTREDTGVSVFSLSVIRVKLTKRSFRNHTLV